MSIAKFSVMGSEDTFSAACYDIANEGRMTMLLVLAQAIVIVGLLIEICIVFHASSRPPPLPRPRGVSCVG
jgi:hypothetical protein